MSLPSSKRLRGRLVVGVRRGLGTPLRRRVALASLRRLHRLRRRLAPARYTDADPFALVSVDPDRIERSLLESVPNRPQWGRVVDGEWDREWEPFDERAVPRGIRERFEDGLPWRETALFDAYVAQLSRFGNAWGHTSLAGFDRRCAAIETLHESIRTRGYRPRAWADDVPSETLAARVDEVNVDVDREGRLCWRAYGQHRLAIAKLLDVETIPVLVHRRHADWQATREAVRADRAGRASLDHPDLRDLRGDASRSTSPSRVGEAWSSDRGDRR